MSHSLSYMLKINIQLILIYLLDQVISPSLSRVFMAGTFHFISMWNVQYLWGLKKGGEEFTMFSFIYKRLSWQIMNFCKAKCKVTLDLQELSFDKTVTMTVLILCTTRVLPCSSPKPLKCRMFMTKDPSPLNKVYNLPFQFLLYSLLYFC